MRRQMYVSTMFSDSDKTQCTRVSSISAWLLSAVVRPQACEACTIPPNTNASTHPTIHCESSLQINVTAACATKPCQDLDLRRISTIDRQRLARAFC